MHTPCSKKQPLCFLVITSANTNSGCFCLNTVYIPANYRKPSKAVTTSAKQTCRPKGKIWSGPELVPRVGSGAVKNRAHSVSWPEVVKGVPNQGVDCFDDEIAYFTVRWKTRASFVYRTSFVSYGSFFCFSLVFLVYVVLCLIVFGCQYQCNWLPGKTCLRNDLLCVEWDVKPYILTHWIEWMWVSLQEGERWFLFSCWQVVCVDTKLTGKFTECDTSRGYAGHTAAVSELDPTRLCVWDEADQYFDLQGE